MVKHPDRSSLEREGGFLLIVPGTAHRHRKYSLPPLKVKAAEACVLGEGRAKAQDLTPRLPSGTCDFRNTCACCREREVSEQACIISFYKSSSVQLTEIWGTPVHSGEGSERTSWLPGREGYVPWCWVQTARRWPDPCSIAVSEP